MKRYYTLMGKEVKVGTKDTKEKDGMQDGTDDELHPMKEDGTEDGREKVVERITTAKAKEKRTAKERAAANTGFEAKQKAREKVSAGGAAVLAIRRGSAPHQST